MKNRLDIPDDLNSLIEKREDSDRRHEENAVPPDGEERRTGEDRREDCEG